MKSVTLFVIQLPKIKRPLTKFPWSLVFLHLGAVILAFQSVKTDALELSECLSRMKSLLSEVLMKTPSEVCFL